MTEAETVLKMIETVDPTDRGKLDEIDLAVTKYLEAGCRLGALVYPLEKDYHTEKIGDLRVVHTTQRARYKYTRSRDVLKTIRPEKWIPKLSRSGRFDRVGEDYRFREWGEFDFVLHGEDYEDWKQVVASAKTEELAELHAIIQAIEWERTYKP